MPIHGNMTTRTHQAAFAGPERSSSENTSPRIRITSTNQAVSRTNHRVDAITSHTSTVPLLSGAGPVLDRHHRNHERFALDAASPDPGHSHGARPIASH